MFAAIWVTVLAQPADTVPLRFTRLDLTDGRKLKNVVVKSYDAKSEKLLIIADGRAMTIPIASLPPPFNQQLKAAPGSGESVSMIPGRPATPLPRVAASAADQYYFEAAVPARQQANTIARATPPAQRPSPSDPMLAAASLAQHQAAARARAEKYFRYEFQMGSNSISVTALEFELGVPSPVPGWSGRCRTDGKAFVEYFDSKGRSFQRTTSTFEIITEQPPNEPLKVIDFSRKS